MPYAIAYHRNTKTIAITLKNRNKSINAWMMKEEDRNEYFHALAPSPFLVVLRQLSFKEKVQRWSQQKLWPKIAKKLIGNKVGVTS